MVQRLRQQPRVGRAKGAWRPVQPLRLGSPRIFRILFHSDSQDKPACDPGKVEERPASCQLHEEQLPVHHPDDGHVKIPVDAVDLQRFHNLCGKPTGSVIQGGRRWRCPREEIPDSVHLQQHGERHNVRGNSSESDSHYP